MKALKISSDPPSMRNWKRCATFTAIVVAVFVVILVIYVVFLPKQPIITVNSVHLKGFMLRFNAAEFRFKLNVTMILNISVTNPNKCGFSAKNGSAVLWYGGLVVGEAVVPAGEIGAKETVEKVMRLNIMVNNFLSDGNLTDDITDDWMLVIKTTTMLPGKVRFLGLRHRMVLYMTCDAVINVWGRTVNNSNCKSWNKF